MYEVPLILALNHSDSKIKFAVQKSLGHFAYNGLRYQVSVYRTIGPLVSEYVNMCLAWSKIPTRKFFFSCRYKYATILQTDIRCKRSLIFTDSPYKYGQSIELWTCKSVNLQTCRKENMRNLKTSKIAENCMYKPLCISLICI